MVVEEIWVEKMDATTRPLACSLESGTFDAGVCADVLTTAAFSQAMPADAGANCVTAENVQAHVPVAAAAGPSCEAGPKADGNAKACPRDAISSFYRQSKAHAPHPAT